MMNESEWYMMQDGVGALQRIAQECEQIELQLGALNSTLDSIGLAMPHDSTLKSIVIRLEELHPER